MKKQEIKNKPIWNIICWILLVPITFIVAIFIALLFLPWIDFIPLNKNTYIAFYICLILATTAATFFTARFIAPKYKNITGALCALLGLYCATVLGELSQWIFFFKN